MERCGDGVGGDVHHDELEVSSIKVANWRENKDDEHQGAMVLVSNISLKIMYLKSLSTYKA